MMSTGDRFGIWVASLLGAFAISTTAADAQSVEVEIEAGHSFTEPRTGLLFARSFAGLNLILRTDYDDKIWGTCVRYRHPERSEWVDVYIYDRGLDEINDKDELAQTLGEIDAAFSGIMAFAGEGKSYRRVVIDEQVETRTLELGEQKIEIASQGAQLEKRDPHDAEKFNPFRTSISVATYRNQFVKLRHTIPGSLGKKASAERRVEVIESFLRLVGEHALRPTIEKAIAAYSKDPLSEKGTAAGGTIVAYAEASHIVSVSISAEVVPILDGVEEGLGAKFLTAYLVGCVREQLGNGPADPYPGVLEQLKLYRRLRDKGELVEPLPAFEAWEELRDAGVLDAHVATLGNEAE